MRMLQKLEQQIGGIGSHNIDQNLQFIAIFKTQA
jgi:hypothetical protein